MLGKNQEGKSISLLVDFQNIKYFENDYPEYFSIFHSSNSTVFYILKMCPN